MPPNFAVGIFLVIVQPFKVGDFIVADPVTGTVEEFGLFVTSINTHNNVRKHRRQRKDFRRHHTELQTNPYRRVDPQEHTVDVHLTIAALEPNLAKIPNVLTDPAPDLEILSVLLPVPFWRCVRIATLAGVLRHQPCHSRHRSHAGVPAREPHFMLRIAAAAHEVGETIPESDPAPVHDPETMRGYSLTGQK